MPERGRGRIRGWVEGFIDQGVTPAVREPLRKRVRLTNIAALVGALISLATMPFDLFEVRWMAWEDLGSAIVFASLVLLNRRGHLTASRLACLGLANLLALVQAATLGRDSGADLFLLGLVMVPFALFDLDEWRPLVTVVLVPALGFLSIQLGILDHFRRPPAGYVAQDYHLYSGILAMAIVLVTLLQLIRENARAERALRLDIAERRRTERDLVETRQASITSAKMAALGEMSANVAHEVNNPLAAILLRAQRLALLAQKDRLDVPAVVKAAREIDATVERIRRIIDALRFFARQADEDPPRIESVGAIVGETVELCAMRFRQRDVDLTVAPITADLFVECRGAQISQVLLNLLSNAYDAVEGAPVRRVRITTDAVNGEVRIAVTDSGPGIPAEVAHRIMEPFFTTKQIGRGTGLGLSVSKGIAEAHGGRLTLDHSSPETRFVLTLARCQASAANQYPGELPAEQRRP